MTDTSLPSSDLDQVRNLLLGAELDHLREQLAELAPLRARVEELESIVSAAENRAKAVDEVLVKAASSAVERSPGELGIALRSEIEVAVHSSARSDSTVLADALYPVLGPTIRKMIASMFSFDNSGNTFRVEQVLLIERTTGLLLSSTATDQDALDDADVVSGMIDAITSFVQEAFDTPDNDGLQDLRVGDTAVLVEWGPRAVLASVVKGIPTPEYRSQAAVTLEQIHLAFADGFAEFDGNLEPFEAASEPIAALHESGISAKKSRRGPLVLAVLVAILIAAVVAGIWLF